VAVVKARFHEILDDTKCDIYIYLLICNVLVFLILVLVLLLFLLITETWEVFV
jgi:hypothetical protein